MSGFCMAQRWALGPPCAAPGPVLILARPCTTPGGEKRHDVRHPRVQAGPPAGRGAPRVWFNGVGVPALVGAGRDHGGDERGRRREGRNPPRRRDDRRSEEHTSELQSQSNLVCRLLLEKKKTDA